MSNGLRFDSLLLRALAAELENTLAGARAARAQFDRERRAFMLECGTRRQPFTLTWNLRPAAGHVLLNEGHAARAGALLQLARGAPIAAVRALPDERIVRFEFDAGAAAAGIVRAIVLELTATRWNAYALGHDDVIGTVLVPRPDDPRGLRPGVPYRTPTARARAGVSSPPPLEEWQDVLAPVTAAERERALLNTFAYTSSLNAAWILGDARLPEAGSHVLSEAYRRYRSLIDSPPRPCLLPGLQPYPHSLDTAATPTASLLAAFAIAAEASPVMPVSGGEAARHEQALARLYERSERQHALSQRLNADAAGAAQEAALLRHRADLVMAHLHELQGRLESIELTDFDGTPIALTFDPARSPRQNAEQWYEQARRRELAARRAPGLLRRAAEKLRKLDELRGRLESGTASEAEIQELLHETAGSARPVSLPYRTYRTSGGLEVRVGRNARANDSLTREFAAPEDIWLHARDAAGAHVVLRWQRRSENPPRADLLEAAGLAALHSRGRTSAVVAVDWTRRKYVRKPRKAPPGQVIMERAATLFVAPDARLERRLRADAQE